MAKVKHNHSLYSVDRYFSQTQKKGIFYLYAEDRSLSGRFVTIDGIKGYHFGTTGYPVLPQDERLKMAAMVMAMGSTSIHGQDFYADHFHPDINKAWKMVFRKLKDLKLSHKAQMTPLRDPNYKEKFQGVFQNQGFIQITMPKGCKLFFWRSTTLEEWFSRVSKWNRRHFRKEIEPFLGQCDSKVRQHVARADMERYDQVYLNLQRENLGINMFLWPRHLFLKINNHPGWKLLELYTKDGENSIIGVVSCYYFPPFNCYTPALIGVDYRYNTSQVVYRQLLYYSIKNGLEKKVAIIDLGFSAAFEKKKLAAELLEAYAYLQSNDNFKLDLLELSRND